MASAHYLPDWFIVAYTAAGVNAAGAGTTEATRSVAPELSELARMATWRLSQLNWQNQIDSQLTDIFTAAPAAPGLTSAPQRASQNPAPTTSSPP